jgi:hypothetical protein
MSQELHLNGINADTGGPVDGDMFITTDMIAKVARGQKISPEDLKDAKMKKSLSGGQGPHFGVAEGIDDTNLAEAGWSVIFPASLPQKSVDGLKEALKPLLDLRKEQASGNDETFYKEVIGPEKGFKNGETKNEFLKRFGRGPGPAIPAKFPYYAMIVGSPETIPYTFQYQLDVQYAVGRIYFERLEDYYQYATSVVAAENKKIARAKKSVFFGVANPDDRATQMSSTGLIKPLAKHLKAKDASWAVDVVDPAKATKANLANYMGGKDTPALLFTASHGMNFKTSDPRLLPHTGSLLCGDWPGPKARVPVTDKMYFSADDIASDADVFGMIAFVFACYGGGIPKSDNFYRQAFGEQKDIAPYAFVSQLPLRLLSHPKGGALGVFAHVERAWGSSIEWEGVKDDIATFESMTDALMNGKPAGVATEYFNERYAEISTMLTEELDQTTPETQDDVKLAGMWTSNNDARNYSFIGDPAVRLAVDDKATAKAEREKLGAIVSAAPASVASFSAGFQPDVVDRAPAAKAASDAGPKENFSILSDLGNALSGKKDESTPAPSGGSEPTSTGSAVNETLKKFMDKLGDYLSKALDDATSLEISTYVADDMATVKYESGKEGGKYVGAKMRAMTRINLDGDTLVCIPEKDGEVDVAVWNIHLEMVKQAQASRADLMKTVIGAATNIAGIIK